MSNKEVFEDFRKRALWFIKEVEKNPNQQYSQPAVFSIRNFIEKMEMDKYEEYPWLEFQDEYPSRYIIKVGRFGAYFYDNKLECDLDLKAVLMQLRKLELMEKK